MQIILEIIEQDLYIHLKKKTGLKVWAMYYYNNMYIVHSTAIFYNNYTFVPAEIVKKN